MKYWGINSTLKRLAARVSWIIYRKKGCPSFLIASTGRSGSTMLSHYIMHISFKSKFRLKKVPRFVFFPAFYGDKPKYLPGAVYKTHSLSDQVPNDVLSIFIYDDPVTTYESFYNCVKKYGESWGRQHLKNLGSQWQGSLFDKEHDILNYEKQLESWKGKNNCLIIRFTNLWDYEASINAFIGVSGSLPPKKKRSSKFQEEALTNSRNQKLYKLYLDFPQYKLTKNN
jgi:hypothetical protein